MFAAFCGYIKVVVFAYSVKFIGLLALVLHVWSIFVRLVGKYCLLSLADHMWIQA